MAEASTGQGGALRWGSPRARWVLAATIGGSGLALLDGTTVNVALPSIAADLDASVSELQWTINGYMLTLASLILLAGSLADRFGRRRVFVIGICWFAMASVLCAIAPTIELLVLARILQGVGGALLTPGSLAILQGAFAPGDRARAIGAWSGLGAIAAAVGPLLGGWLTGTVGWRAIFWVNLPLAAAVVWISLRHVPESRAEIPTVRFDYAGAVLATLGLAGLTWALIAGGERGFSPTVAAVGMLGVASLVGFLIVERRAADPMMPLVLFRSRQFSATNAVTFLVYGGMAVMFLLLMVELQLVLGFTPLLAGTALLPITLLMLALSARAGALAERIGPRRPMTIGPLLMGVAMWLTSQLETGSSFLLDVLPAVTLFGLGLAAMVAPLTATVLAAAGEGRSGVASGINNAISRTAGLLFVAAVPQLVGLRGDAFTDAARFADGFTTAMQLCAVVVAVGGAIAWITIEDRLPDGTPACPTHRMLGRRRCPVAGAPLEPEDVSEAAN